MFTSNVFIYTTNWIVLFVNLLIISYRYILELYNYYTTYSNMLIHIYYMGDDQKG